MPEEPSSPQEEERGESDLLDEIVARLPIAEGGLIDLLSAILLSVTVVASALSAWQASLWSGEQATLFAEASTARLESNRETAIALTRSSYDAATFVDASAAFASNDQAVLDLFNERLFRDEFQILIDEWVALDPLNDPNAPKTPFGLDGVTDVYMAESIVWDEIASEKFEAGKEANQNNDNWILATVLFASVLFFAGISTKFKSPRIRALSIGIATVALVGSIILVATLPRLVQV